MAFIWSVLYMAAFALSGIMISRLLFSGKRPVLRLWLGLVIGLVMMIWLPALFSYILSFCLLSQLLALAVVCAAGTACFWIGRHRECPSAPWRDELPLLLVVIPLMLVAAVLLYTHVILEKDGALYVGQSTYGDLSMHLGFISSIAEQGVFPPMYSICPDTPVGYPFLSSSLSSTFYLLGCSLRMSVLMPSLYAFLLVFSGAYFFFEAWLGKKNAAVLASYLFFVGGGFGFAYFFDLLKVSPENLTRLFTAFYETPTNFPTLGLRWVNPIADMLIPQRAILFGWAILFPCLYLLYQTAFCGEQKLFIPLGILGGCLPLIHTHSFFALGVISAFYLLRSLFKNEGRKQWLGYLWYFLAALVIAAPQLIQFTFRQSSGFLAFHWNWDNRSDNFFWFYIKNMGLIFLLMPVAFFVNGRKDRAVYGGALLLWAIAELIQFQPNLYDNNKLLFVWFFFSCGLVAKFLVGARSGLLNWKRERTARFGIRILSCILCLSLFLSGVLTLVREYLSNYELISADEVAAAEYIKDNTEPESVFLTYNNHNNAVAALTGRNIVCGSGTFLYFHGVDYEQREQALPLLFEEPDVYFDTLGSLYEIDYVLIGSHERYNYNCDIEYFDTHFELVYDARGVMIYKVSRDPSGNDIPA